MKNIFRKELFWILFLTVVLFGLSYGGVVFRNYARVPAGFSYWGAEEYPLDLTGNLATVREGYSGHWQSFFNYTSTMPEQRSLLKMEYLLMGHAARIFRLDTTMTFYLARFLISVVYLVVIYVVIRSVFVTTLERVTAYGFVLFSPAIMIAGEGEGFYYRAVIDALVTHRLLLAMPHYLLGGLFGLLSLFFLAKTIDRPADRRSFLWSVVSGFIAAFAYAPTMALIVSTIPVFFAVHLVRLRHTKGSWGMDFTTLSILFSYAVLVCLPVMYVRYVVAFVWEGFRAASHLEKLNKFAVPLDEYFRVGGGAYLLAVIGLPTLLKEARTLPILLATWILMHPVGAYLLSPVLELNSIRYFLTPYVVVFGVLAVYGIRQAAVLVHRIRVPRVLMYGIVSVVVVVSGYYSYKAMNNRTNVCFCIQPYFTFAYPRNDVMHAIHWLRDHTKESDTVLSLYYAGTLIPAFAGNRVYTSWWFRLVEPPTMQAMTQGLKRFYGGQMGDQEAQAFLAAERIAYVLYSDEERAYAPELNGLSYPMLTPVFTEGATTVYAVVK